MSRKRLVDAGIESLYMPLDHPQRLHEHLHLHDGWTMTAE
jgi:hypothetical protein